MSAVLYQYVGIFLERERLGPSGCRAATFLLRQLLEQEVAAAVSGEVSGSFSANLVLFRLERGPRAGRRAALLWNQLSEACHAQGHELAPTRAQVRLWQRRVGEVCG